MVVGGFQNFLTFFSPPIMSWSRRAYGKTILFGIFYGNGEVYNIVHDYS